MNYSKKKFHLPVLLSVLCLLASCGEETADGKQTQAVTGASTEAVTEIAGETAIPFNSLPDDLDYQGETVTILGWEHYEDVEFTTEAEIGEIVNDAVYVRNRNVSERLNVALEFSETGGRSGDAQWMNQIRNSNKAGDWAYDIIAGHSHNIGTLAKGGELYNLLSCEYLDFTQPWWRSELTERAVIRNQLYFATGDISPSSIARTQGVFFNKTILGDFDLEDPYQLVVDGTWTLEKMISMTKGIYQDLNADGKKDEAGDRFGFAVDTVQTQAVAITSDILTIGQDADGLLIIDPDYYTDRTISVLDMWVDYMANSEDTTFISTVDDDSMFAGGRALFYAFPLGIISSSLRNCDFGIGFVPWPKADAQQEDYVTCTSNAYSLWGLPLAVENPALSAAVMEAMAYEGFVNITPALFETAYKVKYNETGNELQSQVFDILRSNLVFDLGRIMSSSVTGDIFYLFANSINSKKNNIASQYATIEKRTTKQLEKWMEELEEMEMQ